jgi:hypothetical protein
MFLKRTSTRIPSSGQFVSQQHIFAVPETESVFRAEVRDLVRYLTTIVFAHQTIRDYDNVNVKRIGTHPVENFFGLVGLACHDSHSWDCFRGSVAKGNLAGDLIAAHGLKEHIRRDFSVGGAKAINQSNSDNKLVVPRLLEYGMDYVALLTGQKLEEREKVMALWIQDLVIGDMEGSAPLR